MKLAYPTLVRDASVPILRTMPPKHGIRKMGACNTLRNEGGLLVLTASVKDPHACFHSPIPELYLLPVYTG